MPDSTDRGAEQSPPPTGDEWMTDYIRRASDFWRRTGETDGSAASKWGDRSVKDGELDG